ncbi:DUF3277 family protein [Laribacter hongkongensis]|uniref:phage protein n=1 Tax=Laribacter hongkongensis TaxID=168471 RepID=UPI001EFD7C69|nr:phage protein [Laribacter hongkongensis]MCG9064716.1 DUF3277 family protein [Laribacter hongkongensis]
MTAKFDPKQVSVLLNGYAISDWADGSDVISYKAVTDAGSYTIGANGTGVFIANPDESHVLVLKLKQHSPENKWLNDQFRQQRKQIKSFTPFTLEIRDLLNEDVATGVNGFFTTPTDFTRGAGHNPHAWTIVFESGDIKQEKGWAN